MKKEVVSSFANEDCLIYKKLMFLIILLVLILSPFISALEIKLSKDSYQPGETLQAEIAGNFVSLKNENILIYKEGIPRSNPVISDLVYQDGTYYFYAILPKQEGNFSLRIQESDYFVDEEINSKDIVKNFTIQKTNQSVLSINPGFVFTDKDFFINLKSLESNQNVYLNLEASQESKNVTLIEGIETPLEFSISNLEPMKTYLLINNYKIPVFITKEGNKTSITEYTDMVFYPSEISGTLLAGNSYYYEIKIFNTGEKNLTNIKLFNDLDLDLSLETISSLKTKSYVKINFTITPEKTIEILSGKISAVLDNKNITLPISFKITEKSSDVNLTTGSQIDCNDIGRQCKENEEVCNGVIRESKQGQCCLGNCVTLTQASSNGLYIGIGIFLAVVIILFYLYKRIIKKQKPKTTEEFLRERTDEYRERLRGREVNKKLDRV